MGQKQNCVQLRMRRFFSLVRKLWSNTCIEGTKAIASRYFRGPWYEVPTRPNCKVTTPNQHRGHQVCHNKDAGVPWIANLHLAPHRDGNMRERSSKH